MPVRIVVPGRPEAKARPKINRRTGQVYTPSSEAEEGVANAMREYKGAYFDAGPVLVSLFLYGLKQGTDIDNVAKLYLDALVKAEVIRDDSEIHALWVECCPPDSDGLRVEVVVGEWEG